MDANSQELEDLARALAEVQYAELRYVRFGKVMLPLEMKNPALRFIDPTMELAGLDVDNAKEVYIGVREHYNRLRYARLQHLRIQHSLPITTASAVNGITAMGTANNSISTAPLNHAANTGASDVSPGTTTLNTSASTGAADSVDTGLPNDSTPSSPTDSIYFSVESRPATPGNNDEASINLQDSGIVTSSHDEDPFMPPPPAQPRPPRPVFTPSPPASPAPPPYPDTFPPPYLGLFSSVYTPGTPLSSQHN